MAFLRTAAIAVERGRWRSGYDERRPGKFLCGIVATLLIVLAGKGAVEAQSNGEYQIKAAYLYNFGKFVEWPSGAFSGPSDPFRICILGDSPFDRNLESAFSSRKIQNHPVHVIYPDSMAQSRKCHVLFLSPSESGHMKAIVADLRSDPVLTVADTPGFISAGGMIRFFLEGDSVRFEMNPSPASQAGLKVSSKLLVLGAKHR
ncbi:MAG TPA: YfiR family protein [Terriglobales bacterium]|nr:YfiR family protein [Terriglobales bacterium]